MTSFDKLPAHMREDLANVTQITIEFNNRVADAFGKKSGGEFYESCLRQAQYPRYCKNRIL